jgi:hypothetical protein
MGSVMAEEPASRAEIKDPDEEHEKDDAEIKGCSL